MIERHTSTPHQGPGYTVESGRNDGNGPGSWTDGESRTLGWLPTCDCDAGKPVLCTVLDPFCGIGTTNLVAAQLGRRSIGIDLSQKDIKMAIKRINTGLRPHTHRSDEGDAGPLFER